MSLLLVGTGIYRLEELGYMRNIVLFVDFCIEIGLILLINRNAANKTLLLRLSRT